jgi:hypothetical protein
MYSYSVNVESKDIHRMRAVNCNMPVILAILTV